MKALLFVAFALLADPAWAHKPSDSYLSLAPAGTEVGGRWDISLRDLDNAIGLDADDDGAITWYELRAREAEISTYALSRLRLFSAAEPCVLRPASLLVDRHSDGAYAVLNFVAACGQRVTKLTAEYRLLFDLDPQHRGLVRLQAEGAVRTAIFSPEHPASTFDLSAAPTGQFAEFAKEGIWHIWIGVDHLLFLLALLLPSILVRTGTGWAPVEKLAEAFLDVLKIVTSFTIAHSITLSLAALEVVSAPSRWIETAIALSVLLAALNNIYPVVRGRRWLIAFVFGLIHGFGFASVLRDLGLPQDALLWPLFAFNVGVELGQLAAVAAYFVIASALRKQRLYARALMPAGSVLIAVIAGIWMLERGLDLRLFG